MNEYLSVFSDMWRALLGGGVVPDEHAPPAPAPALRHVAYHCKRCDVAERIDGPATPLRCWNCGRFIKPNTYGVSVTNAGIGVTFDALTNREDLDGAALAATAA